MAPESNETNKLVLTDRAVFEDVFNRYSRDLYMLAWRITASKTVAEDVVQDFFVKLWLNREKIDIRTSFQYYCFSAVQYASLNAIRNSNRDTELSENLEDSCDIEYEIERAELRKRLDTAISQLPEKCRILFQDVCLDGYSYAEVAQKYGLSVNTIKVQISRAYRTLREKLSSEEFFFLSFLFFKNYPEEEGE